MAKSSELKQHTLKGLKWSFLDNALNQGIRFILGLVLARLLTPYDFGIIGIALIFVSISEDIVDGGFTNALIQKKTPSPVDYSTVFVTNLVFSAVLYAVLFLLAPHIAVFFNNPQLTSVIRVISVILLIDAFMFVAKVRLTKDLDFKRLAKISVSSSVISGVVGIIFALSGFGVWSLVFQQLTRHLLNTSLLWFTNKGGLSVRFSKKSFTSLFSFGSKLLITDLTISIYNQLVNVVVGKCYSPATLGQYSRAHQFSGLFSSTLNQIIQRVSYPALSKIQDDYERLLRAYRELIKTTSFVVFSLMLFLAAIAEPLITVLIGNKWLECVPYLQLLCFSRMLQPLLSINMNIFKVKGRSDLCLKLELTKRLLDIFSIALGILVSIYWMLIGSIIVNIVAYLLNVYYSSRLLGYTMKRQLKDITPALMVAGLVSILVFLPIYISHQYYVILPIQILVWLVMLIIVSETIKLDGYLYIKTILKEHVRL